jgi:hypothetical protein
MHPVLVNLEYSLILTLSVTKFGRQLPDNGEFGGRPLGQRETFDRPDYWLCSRLPNLINIRIWETQSVRDLQ